MLNCKGIYPCIGQHERIENRNMEGVGLILNMHFENPDITILHPLLKFM